VFVEEFVANFIRSVPDGVLPKKVVGY